MGGLCGPRQGPSGRKVRRCHHNLGASFGKAGQEAVWMPGAGAVGREGTAYLW